MIDFVGASFLRLRFVAAIQRTTSLEIILVWCKTSFLKLAEKIFGPVNFIDKPVLESLHVNSAFHSSWKVTKLLHETEAKVVLAQLAKWK